MCMGRAGLLLQQAAPYLSEFTFSTDTQGFIGCACIECALGIDDLADGCSASETQHSIPHAFSWLGKGHHSIPLQSAGSPEL